MDNKQSDTKNLTCRAVPTIDAFKEDEWNSLLKDDYPFARHAFFVALEKSEAIGHKSGWAAQYLTVYRGNTLVGAMPCFVKSHPYGEYVFDWSWAEAYEDAGIEYYPKLVCAIPFTPAAGTRLLIVEGEDLQEITTYLLGGMRSLIDQIGCSGAHILFPKQADLPSLTQRGFLERRAVQFHWFNRNYLTFDDFLATLTSRRRKNIRKERKSIGDQCVDVKMLDGDTAAPSDWATFYRFYQRTYLKRSGHTGYLNQAFFERIGASLGKSLVLALAYVNDEPVAGALYFKSSDTLYGRYWGCLAEYENLHFELCYYQGIEYCIQHDLERFDAGAQGEHKLMRGFEPVYTYSAHYLQHQGFHQAIGDYLQREHTLIKQYLDDAKTHLPYRSDLI
ncbi:GNAT family N-acetyltransferase [Enterovibrio norvegicus FF-162]|uniref:GNAT family N-acetyltransferase n=1 Tax=Enterovibrio norvegicus TaxID=188144 RepID=UPI0002DDECAE|nr:GNAT family N-acetyltransferase [Enterovibrio norvegicus]OEE75431.1 GNAT family N-acetyltransferase [Enterovibrio norvegicus FF-162]